MGVWLLATGIVGFSAMGVDKGRAQDGLKLRLFHRHSLLRVNSAILTKSQKPTMLI